MAAETVITVSVSQLSVEEDATIEPYGDFTIDGKYVDSVLVASGGSAIIKIPGLPSSKWSELDIETVGDARFDIAQNTVTVSNIVSEQVKVKLKLGGEESVRVTFNANGGSGVMGAQTFLKGVAGTLAPNTFTAPTDKHCQQFAGWATSPDGNIAYLNCAMITVTADTTLYAIWNTVHTPVTQPGQAATCTQDGYTDWVKCSVCEEELSAPSLVVATGHKPADPVRENEVKPTTETDGHYDRVVYCSVCHAELERTPVIVPKITPETVWQVTYNAGAADAGSPLQDGNLYPHGTEVTVKDKGTLAKTGYVFDGWMDDTQAHTRYYPGEIFQITGNVDLYAQWTPVSYTIRFDANGGTGAPDAITATYDTAMNLPSASGMTREGYRFGGWAVSATTGAKYGDGVTVMNLAAVEGDTATLYAVWNEVEQLKLVDAVDDAGSGRITITKTDTEYIQTDTTGKTADIKTANVFSDEQVSIHVEYADEPAATGETVTGTIDKFDISYAKNLELTPADTQTTYQKTTAKVSYEMSRLGKSDTDLLKDSPVFTTGASASQLDALSGSKIAGLFEGTVGSTVNTKLKQVGMKISFTLDKGWVEERYGISQTDIKKHIRTVHISGSSVESIDYQLSGGGLFADYTLEFVSYEGFSSYAVLCDPLYYSITYDLNGGTWASSEIPDPKILTVLEDTVIPSNEWSIPVKDGYSFVDWYTDAGLQTVYDKSAPVTASQTLYAKWKSNADPTPTPTPRPGPGGKGTPESTRILTPTPTATPTAAPTDVPTIPVGPTGYPTMTPMSPAPVAGIIAGLLGAAVLIRRMRR